MKKEFGAFIFLGILVLSLSFSSAGWFSDVWEKISGGNSGITGNVINSYGFDDSEQYCGNYSTCSKWNTVRCGSKASHLTQAGVNVSEVGYVDLISIGCYSSTSSTWGAKIVSCPAGANYDVCVRNGNDGVGSDILLGVKYRTARAECTENLMLECPSDEFVVKECVNGRYVTVTPAPTCPTEATCTDSDGGENYFVKGTVEYNGTLLDDFCEYHSDTQLIERYCDGSNLNEQIYTCPNGCSNGACVNIPEPVLISSCNETSRNCILLEGQSVNPLNNTVRIASIGVDTVILNIEGINAPKFYVGNGTVIGNLGFHIEDIMYSSKDNVVSSVEFSYDYFPIEPNASCAENYKIRAVNFYDEGGVAKMSLEVMKDGAWNTVAYDKQVGDVIPMGNLEIKPVFINATAGSRYVSFSVNFPGIVDYKYVDEPEKDYVLINSNIVDFEHNKDKFFVVSYCGNTSSSLCQTEVDQIKHPSDLVIEGINWSADSSGGGWGNSDGERGYFASWRMNSGNENSYVLVSVSELSDAESVQRRLNNALENGICQVSRVYVDYENEEYKNVYTCKNLWRIAEQNQQVSNSNAWNYQNDVVALWFNDNLLFSMEFSSNNYNECYSEESCQRIEEENHRRQQEDLIDVVDSLINNKNQYVSTGYLDYISERFVRHFLTNCDSGVEDKGYEGSWSCRMDPAICPPHGEQKQVCTRWNQITNKEESRENTISCNPGICSGCTIPKWFGSTWDSKCVPYGFRFEHQIDFGETVREESDRDILTVGEANRDGEIELTVYNDSHANLMVAEWGNTTYSFKKGDTVKIDVSEWSNGYLEVNMYINDIFYNPSNYSESYIDVTFMAKRLGQEVNSFNAYCDIDGAVKAQKVSQGGEWAKCQNSYECFSNVCSNGECIDTAALAKEITGFKGFIIKMLCRLSNPFSDDGYAQCLVNNQ